MKKAPSYARQLERRVVALEEFVRLLGLANLNRRVSVLESAPPPNDLIKIIGERYAELMFADLKPKAPLSLLRSDECFGGERP